MNDERNIPLLRRWQRHWRWEEFLSRVYYKYCALMELSLAGIPLKTAKNLLLLLESLIFNDVADVAGFQTSYTTPGNCRLNINPNSWLHLYPVLVLMSYSAHNPRKLSVRIAFRMYSPGRLDSDTVLVSLFNVNRITSKELHEQTGAVLDKVKRGQRFRVMRGGEADAMLVPVTDRVDPTWDEIMADVRAAREEIKSKKIHLRANPVLEERKRRKKATLKNHAADLR